MPAKDKQQAKTTPDKEIETRPDGLPAKARRGNLRDNTRRALNGRNKHTAEQRQATCEAAAVAILQGKTLEQIAGQHNISPQTLSIWLSQMEGYDKIRSIWIDQQLSDAEVLIRAAPDQLELARADRLLKAAQWRAERRDRRYSQHAQAQAPSIHVSICRDGVSIDSQPIDSIGHERIDAPGQEWVPE